MLFGILDYLKIVLQNIVTTIQKKDLPDKTMRTTAKPRTFT
jgi:hypothetical protein